MKQPVKLYDFQRKGLEATQGLSRCAFFWSMGLGKSFMGSEKLVSFDSLINLVICQKSKIRDWLDHFQTYYDLPVYDLTKKDSLKAFMFLNDRRIGVINYDLLHRRPELLKLQHVAAVFDESSMIKRTSARRTKAALKLHLDHVVLLSGTPTGGQYENLWSQCKLLGWKMGEDAFLDRYVIYRDFLPPHLKFPISIVAGYKRVDELKERMRQSGANFLRTEEVMSLPEQVFSTTLLPQPKAYKDFMRDDIVVVDGVEFRASCTLNRLNFARQLCSSYCKDKAQAFKDILDSTNERLVVFYTFYKELEQILGCCGDRPVSVVNGKTRDLKNYDEFPNSVTIVQYQAGAKGLNLQKACHMVLYSPTTMAEDYMQCLKRIHRIGQKRTCFYYKLVVEGSVEEHIYSTLATRQDYTQRLFNNRFGESAHEGKAI